MALAVSSLPFNIYQEARVCLGKIQTSAYNTQVLTIVSPFGGTETTLTRYSLINNHQRLGGIRDTNSIAAMRTLSVSPLRRDEYNDGQKVQSKISKIGFASPIF
jgi:hypothetical protein